MLIALRVFDRRALPFRTDFSVIGVRGFLATNSEATLSSARQWWDLYGAKPKHAFRMDNFEDISLDPGQKSIMHFEPPEPSVCHI